MEEKALFPYADLIVFQKMLQKKVRSSKWVLENTPEAEIKNKEVLVASVESKEQILEHIDEYIKQHYQKAEKKE